MFYVETGKEASNCVESRQASWRGDCVLKEDSSSHREGEGDRSRGGPQYGLTQWQEKSGRGGQKEFSSRYMVQL